MLVPVQDACALAGAAAASVTPVIPDAATSTAAAAKVIRRISIASLPFLVRRRVPATAGTRRCRMTAPVIPGGAGDHSRNCDLATAETVMEVSPFRSRKD